MAMGWDVNNEQGYAESYREVIHEDKIKVGVATKAPDYSFRLPGGKKLFFVEAKKPSVVVKDEILPAYQVRRYGWSARLPLSIITDFEEFALYDCTIKPNPTDKASVARIRYLTYKDYLKEFDFLWDTFSKERVLQGGFDKFVQSDTHKKGTATVDKEFVRSLENWRTYLAKSISWNNKNLDEDEINFAVQQTIDRLIFIRIAEDRFIEPYGSLADCVKQGNLFQNLFQLFVKADQKYNSGLFNFAKDKISATLNIDNKVIRTIITELYYPDCRFAFSVMPVEILGTAYEQFLGKVIRITPGHIAKIEEKPEVRKAGGVYYTPQYIVDYIVKNTLGKLIDADPDCGKKMTPDDVSNIKIVDPACGSGSFLLGAYQYLLNWHLNYYSAHSKLSVINPNNLGGRKGVGRGLKSDVLTPDGNLTTTEKKRILLNNIYGVDIDVNAVEVTKLSLLLKCMEGETSETIEHQLSIFHERVLPTLDNNIKDGNSLIGTDIYNNQLELGFEKKVKPFDWQKAFPEVFNRQGEKPENELKALAQKAKQHASKALQYVSELEEKMSLVNEPSTGFNSKSGFDVLIGNPPYVRQEMLGEQKGYFQSHYSVYHGMADLYSYFIQKGIRLLNPNGIFGVIVANKWMRANYGEPLRKFIKQLEIHELIDFGDLPVFENATTYPCILIAGKSGLSNTDFKTTLVKTLNYSTLDEYVEQQNILVSKSSLDDKGWNLASDVEQTLLTKIKSAGIPLGDYVDKKIFYGIKTSLNEAFVIDETTKERLIQEDNRSAEIIKPFLAGRDIKRYQKPESNKYLILFPKGFTNQKGNHPKNAWKWLVENYPAIANYLAPFKKKAEKRLDKGDYWWELRACDYYTEFEKPKIIYPNILSKPEFTFDSGGWYTNQKCFIISLPDKYLLGILNSRLNYYLFEKYLPKLRGGFYEPSYVFFKNFPIVNNPDDQSKSKIISLVNHILKLNDEMKLANLESKRLQIKGKIDFCEDRINEIVYELYGLDKSEINLINQNLK